MNLFDILGTILVLNILAVGAGVVGWALCGFDWDVFVKIFIFPDEELRKKP